MKFIEAADSATALPTIQLTRRNLEILLMKLSDKKSMRTIVKDGVAVHAVEDHGLEDMTFHLIEDGWAVAAVENESHYSDREPGAMLMPSSGEII